MTKAKAKAKKASATAAGPVFPLGDPGGVVRWTPPLLKKVFPRRELGLKAPKTAAPGDIVANLRANAEAWWGHFEAGAEVPGADAALHDGLRAARAWLDGDYTVRPSIETAALAYQLAVPGDGFRAESFAARMVDLWVGAFGLPFALDALAAAFAIAQARGPTMGVASPNPKPRRGYGDGPTTALVANALTLVRASHVDLLNLTAAEIPKAVSGARMLVIHFVNDDCRAWLRLREHLASAPEAVWLDCVARGEVLRGHPDPVVRHLVAFSFPERPAWAEALVGEKPHILFPMLSACLPDPGRLPYVTLEYFFTEFDRTAVSLLAAAGPRAVPHLIELAKRARGAANTRLLYNLVAQVDASQAEHALAGASAEPYAQQAIAAMRANFPKRAVLRAKGS